MLPRLVFGLCASVAAAQTSVPTPKPGVTVVSSVLDGAEISYRKVFTSDAKAEGCTDKLLDFDL